MKKRIFIVGIAVAVVVAILVCFFLCRGLAVDYVECVKSMVEDYYVTEGKISFGNDCVISSPVSGKVVSIVAEEGSKVSAGDVILVIQNHELKAGLEQAKAEFSKAEAEFRLNAFSGVNNAVAPDYMEIVKADYTAAEATYEAAKKSFEVNSRLYADKTISATKYMNSQAEYESAKSEYSRTKNLYETASVLLENLKQSGVTGEDLTQTFYDALKDSLEAPVIAAKALADGLQKQYDDCSVKAPADGIVAKIHVKNLQYVSEGADLVLFYGSEKPYVESDVLTNVASYITEGSPIDAVISMRGDAEHYSGNVSEVRNYALKGVSAIGLNEYRVHIKSYLDDDVRLNNRNGYGVSVKYRLFSSDKYLVIPVTAVLHEDSKDYVYIRGNKGLAEKKAVSCIYKSSSVCAVSSGLSEGDFVVADVYTEGLEEGVRLAK